MHPDRLDERSQVIDEEDELIVDLPPREALSIVDPGIFGLRNPMILGRTADTPTTDGPAAELGASPT